MILSCHKLKKSFSENEILKDVGFIIEEKEKIAIVGVNGAGKTTLFKIITGELLKDDGELIFNKNLNKIGYLAQMLDLDDNKNIYESLLQVFEDLINIENEIRESEKLMASLEGQELADLMNKYSRLTHTFEELKGYEYKSRIRGVIKGLGFSDEESEKPVGILSGGQKSRVSLGKLLLTNPDLLLLDEPTNHLDITSIEWLEDYLRNYDGTVLIISHDRYFINKVATKIIELENGISSVYVGDYATYAKQKEVDRQNKIKQYMEQQKEIKRQEDVIKTLKSFNREKSIKRAESREKLLAKMIRLEKPEDVPENMRLRIVPKKQSGNDVLDVNDLKKSFDDFVLFENVNFSIKKGNKVALIGPNGIGKTTLIKIIMSEYENDYGRIKLGTNVTIGYYDQVHQNLNLEKTIFDEVYDDYPDLTVLEIRNALACFLFTGDDVFKTIDTLSGGEKGRVSLAKIMLSHANFLILDEPTNHLDVYSKEILEETLRNYGGTVLYISHDRYFINNTADTILELTPSGMNYYLGNYDYYLEKKSEKKEIITEKKDSDKKNTWIDNKEKQSSERKKKAQIRKTENEISKLENEIKSLEDILNKPENASNHILLKETFENKMILENDLEELYQCWEELHD